LLYWALPQFADPPILGNAVDSAAYELERLSRSSTAGSHLGGIGLRLRWLFARQSEGVLLAMAAAALFFACAVAAATLFAYLHKVTASRGST